MNFSVLDEIRRERQALADTAEKCDPEHPTLCGDWTVRDLLAHLVIRDRRPDAGAGIFVPVLSMWTQRVQERLASREISELVETVRTGPPAYVAAAYPPLDRVDLLEYFVHHEDIRRAGAEWTPREPDVERDRALWAMLAVAGPSMHLRSPVGVVLRRTDGAERRVHPGLPGRGRVVVTGDVGELVLHTVGRDVADVIYDGEPEDIAALRRTPRTI